MRILSAARWCARACTAIVLAACSGPSTAPAGVSLASAGADRGSCPSGGVVVATEAELLAAVSAPVPGQPIALDGMIEVASANVRLEGDGLRLTCATQGAGIMFRNGRRLETFGNDVTIDHLVFDATDGGPLPVILFGSDALPCCVDVRFAHNVVTGFQLTGVFAVRRITGLAVTHNRFEASASTLSAVQIQGGLTDGVVAGNTILAPLGAFAGISVLGAENMSVEHNVVTGSPFAAMRLGTLRSVWRANHVQGAAGFGMLFEFPDRRDNVIRNNRITGAGTAGILVREACHNLFLGNSLHGNDDDVGVAFELTTGGNVFAGPGRLVVDDGAADCDGDGTANRNVVTGRGPVRGGLQLATFTTPGAAVMLEGEPVVLR